MDVQVKIGATKGLTSGSVDRHGQKESIRVSGGPYSGYPPIDEERDARLYDDETKRSIIEERKIDSNNNEASYRNSLSRLEALTHLLSGGLGLRILLVFNIIQKPNARVTGKRV